MKNKTQSLLNGLKNVFGVGIYLLLIGLLLEALMMIAHKYVSIPITISLTWQLILTFVCVAFCLSGMIWFNKTLNLFAIHLAGGENELMTKGPFNYIRHPLYATLLSTLPPILIIWYEDILFIAPWILIYIIAKNMVKIEERGLVRIFGDQYDKYREFVPALIPYKGSGGKKYRDYYEDKNKNQPVEEAQ